MNKYILLSNNVVLEILPEFVEDFPEIPIESRYPASLLSKCVVVDEAIEVQQNWVYDSETNTFSEPPQPQPEPVPVPEPVPEPEPET